MMEIEWYWWLVVYSVVCQGMCAIWWAATYGIASLTSDIWKLVLAPLILPVILIGLCFDKWDERSGK
jgi:hypothetical protein